MLAQRALRVQVTHVANAISEHAFEMFAIERFWRGDDRHRIDAQRLAQGSNT